MFFDLTFEGEHRLAASQVGPRMTLFDNEIAAIIAMREKGRAFD
jgi:hypothetical protein